MGFDALCLADVQCQDVLDALTYDFNSQATMKTSSHVASLKEKFCHECRMFLLANPSLASLIIPRK